MLLEPLDKEYHKVFNKFKVVVSDTGQPIKDKVYYLASPYSHPEPYIQEMRYILTTYIGSLLTKVGYTLIEPIGMSHNTAKMFKLPTGYEFWKTRDRLLINKCDGVILLQLKGWEESEGVKDEIEFAKKLWLPIFTVKSSDINELLRKIENGRNSI